MSTRSTRLNLRRSTRFTRAKSRQRHANRGRGEGLVISKQRFKPHKWREEWVSDGHLLLKKYVKTEERAVPAAKPPGFRRKKRRRVPTTSTGHHHGRTEISNSLVAFISAQQDSEHRDGNSASKSYPATPTAEHQSFKFPATPKSTSSTPFVSQTPEPRTPQSASKAAEIAQTPDAAPTPEVKRKLQLQTP